MSPTGNDPKLGEQIVPPPGAPIVAPPPAPPTSPSGLSTAPAAGENLAVPTPIPTVTGPTVAPDPIPTPEAPSVAVDGVPVEEAAAEAVAEAAVPAEPVMGENETTILLEGGQGIRRIIDKRDARQFRVRASDGLYYEHVSNAPRKEGEAEGEWEYRQTS